MGPITAGQYFVTGDLSAQIFDDGCRFRDPTNDIKGLSRYLRALAILFDPEYSGVKLLSIRVADENTIEASWILGAPPPLPPPSFLALHPCPPFLCISHPPPSDQINATGTWHRRLP